MSINPCSVISSKDIKTLGITATNTEILFQLPCEADYPAVYKCFLNMMRNVHEFTYALMRGHSERNLVNNKGGHPNVWLSIIKATVT